MSHKLFAFVCLATLCGALPSSCSAQASPTASRVADLQAGVTFSYARPDYGKNWKGYGFYADLDVRRHLGLEFDFHQLSGPNPVLYERTYEIGPRFLYPIHDRFIPYAKAMYGRGVFNFAGTDSSGNAVQVANLAYNLYTVGGGLDIKTIRGLNIRAIDCEYQTWPNFPPHGLTPAVFSFGVAYHFHGGLTR
jgi:hypothetical protein